MSQQQRRFFNRLNVFLFFYVLFANVIFNASAVAGEDVPYAVKDIEYDKPAPLISPVSSRIAQSLNGKWNVVLDRNGVGAGVYTAFYKNRKPTTGMELIEYSFDSRMQLDVPGDWNTQKQELFFFEGSVWYQRDFEIRPEAYERYYLHFGAANYTTDVYLNGELLGRHRGGYTPFNFELTEKLKSGKNSVVVRVDNTLDKDSIPTRSIDWMPYGGLVRDVSILAVPKTYIGQFAFKLDSVESGRISGSVKLYGADISNKKVTVSIPEAGFANSAVTDDRGQANLDFEVKNLALWSPRSPKLYDVDVAIDGDNVSDRIGFRTVSVNGNRIYLNGKPVKLHGISTHEESIIKPGVAFDKKDALKTLNLVKELGANYVRLAHYPHNEHTVRLADELGLLIWSEMPHYWAINWNNAETLEQAKQQFSELIERDINRASVMIWSLANETPDNPQRLRFLSQVAEHVRSKDNSRIISAALYGREDEFMSALVPRVAEKALAAEGASTEQVREISQNLAAFKSKHLEVKSAESKLIKVTIADPLGKVIDVVGYNEYFGWYYAPSVAEILGISEGDARTYILELMTDFRISNIFNKPIIISEFGAGAKQGFRTADAELWSEEYQEKVYRAQVDMLPKSEQIQGMSPWILKDFRSYLRPLNGIQDFYNRKGLVSEKGKKKKAFYVLQRYYKEPTH